METFVSPTLRSKVVEEGRRASWNGVRGGGRKRRWQKSPPSPLTNQPAMSKQWHQQWQQSITDWWTEHWIQCETLILIWGKGGDKQQNKNRYPSQVRLSLRWLHASLLFVCFCRNSHVTALLRAPRRRPTNSTGTSSAWFLLRCFLLTFHLLVFPIETHCFSGFSGSGSRTQLQLQCCPPMTPKCKLQFCLVGLKSAKSSPAHFLHPYLSSLISNIEYRRWKKCKTFFLFPM